MNFMVIGVGSLLGLVAIIGWFRAWQLSHHHHGHHQTTKTDPDSAVNGALDKASEQLSQSIDTATELFQKNLNVQALKINDTLEGIASQRLRKQVDDFTSVMDGLSTTATSSVAQLESMVDARRRALEASMTTEVVQEKQRAVDHFYDHLSDLVAGYVIESLGDDIDLSGQLPFVLKVLEQNKAIIKEDVLGEH